MIIREDFKNVNYKLRRFLQQPVICIYYLRTKFTLASKLLLDQLKTVFYNCPLSSAFVSVTVNLVEFYRVKTHDDTHCLLLQRSSFNELSCDCVKKIFKHVLLKIFQQ